MGKFFKSKDILLLGLAGVLDIFEEIKDPLHFVSSSYKSMYGWVPNQYKKHNYYQLVSRSLKANLIDKVEKKGEIYMRITSEGKKVIQRDFPMLLLQNKHWDGRWRIIMFDVEEVNKKARNRLRRKLKELGFGMLQKSVFISPHDLLRDFSEFAQASGIKDYLYLLETHKLVAGPEREFANRIWRLDDLNERYKDIVAQIDKIKNSHLFSIDDRSKKSDSGAKENMQKTCANIRNNWLKIVIDDPFLPKMFLPKPWYGEIAKKLVKELV